MRWLPIRGFEGRYEVSDHGDVRSLPRKFCPRGKTLRPRAHRDGYVTVALYDGANVSRQFFIHRLVGAAFLGDAPEGLPDINHQDGVKTNNHYLNLEWSNDSLNVAHAFQVLKVKRAITRPWLGKFGDDHHGSKAVIRFGGDQPEKRYGSVSLTARDGFSFKHVSAVCRGKRQRHGGFQWRFEETQ